MLDSNFAGVSSFTGVYSPAVFLLIQTHVPAHFPQNLEGASFLSLFLMLLSQSA